MRSLKSRFGDSIIARTSLTRALLTQVRIEIAALRLVLARHLSPSYRRRLAALARQRDVYANIGCGPSLSEGFVNVDLHATDPRVVAWDCRRRLPFTSGSVRGLLVEHFFEHLDRADEVPVFLAECRRVLAPGGRVRIIVPDAERFLLAYASKDRDAWAALGWATLPDDLPTPMDVVAHTFIQSGEHKWAYDAASLGRYLRDAGLTDVVACDFRAGGDPKLAVDLESHRAYSLRVEATKAR